MLFIARHRKTNFVANLRRFPILATCPLNEAVILLADVPPWQEMIPKELPAITTPDGRELPNALPEMEAKYKHTISACFASH